MGDTEINKNPRPRLYGRRKGRPLRVNKSRLYETLLPQLDITLDAAKNPTTLFPSPFQELWLEIGFGGGEHLASIAHENPNNAYIGAEHFINGIASILEHIEDQKLQNIKIYPGDARLVMEALPEKSLMGCFILYPDPWPKSKHEKRRFVGVGSLQSLARLMRMGATLTMASDDHTMIEWMGNQMQAQKTFRPIHTSTIPPQNWHSTRYEQKAIKAGRIPHYFVFERI